MRHRLQVAFGAAILCAALGARCGDFNFNPIIAPALDTIVAEINAALAAR
jgi:hypothetical protein